MTELEAWAAAGQARLKMQARLQFRAMRAALMGGEEAAAFLRETGIHHGH